MSLTIQTAEVTDKIYFDMSIGGKPAGRIIIECFGKVVPKTVKNFVELCRAKKFVGSPSHRVIKDFMIQMGDYTNKNGTGGMSIYGSRFEDENFNIRHAIGAVSCANCGPNTNGSQFFICTCPCDWLNGKHVVWGRCATMDIVNTIQNLPTGSMDRPLKPVIVEDCGVL